MSELKQAIELEIKDLEKQIEYTYEGSEKRKELDYVLKEFQILLRRFQ